MLEFVTFKWGEAYSLHHVAMLRDGLARHYRLPHRLTLISDRPDQDRLDGVRTLRLWDEPRLVGHCMTRIKMFDPAMADLIGPRFCWLDLDLVPVADVTPIFSRTEAFIACGVEKPWQPYNGSMVMMDAGARPQVYADFEPSEFYRRRKRFKYGDGDQGWIACALGPDEARWTEADGVFSYRDHIEHSPDGALPEGARLVIFNSRRLDPSMPHLQARSPWIAEHWR